MSEMIPQGVFIGCDLITHDETKASAFYTELLGWRERRIEIKGGQYRVFHHDEMPIAGMMPLPADRSTPPHWLVHISVSELEQAKRRVIELGGRVIVPEIEMSGTGRFAVVADPDGALLAIHQSAEESGHRPSPAGPGHFCWYEVAVRRVEETKNFYRQLFNWGHKVLPQAAAGDAYTVFSQAGNDVAGLMKIPAGAPYPPHWLAYIESADLETSVAKAKSLGGAILLPITEISNNMGSFAVLQDPTGGIFALWRKG